MKQFRISKSKPKMKKYGFYPVPFQPEIPSENTSEDEYYYTYHKRFADSESDENQGYVNYLSYPNIVLTLEDQCYRLK
jgi:hypothetical protein